MLNFSITILLLAMLNISNAIANSMTQSVVKITSKNCTQPHSQLQGSGILFELNSQFYVITSEHVIFHDNDVFCHQIHSSFGKFTTQLIRSDWGTGLALLKVETDEPINKVLSINDFSTEPLTKQSKIISLGFPFDSWQIYTHNGGEVLEPKSKRHLFANGDTIIELINSYGEYGMSGGGVFSQDGKVIGLLSHQYLPATSNGKKFVQIFDQNSQQQSHLLAIDSANIKKWIIDTLSLSYQTYFSRNALEQLAGINSIQSNGVTFIAKPTTTICKTTTAANTRKTLKSLNIQDLEGSDNPIGIGGDGENGNPNNIEIIVKRNDTSSHTNWYLSEKSTWIDQIKKNLDRQAQIKIPYLVYRGNQFEEIRPMCFSSLEDFFRKLSIKNMFAVTLVTNEFANIVPTIEVEKIRTLANNLDLQLDKIAIPTQSFDANEALVRKNILQFQKTAQLYISLLQSEQWYLIRAEDIQNLANQSGEYSLAWTNIRTLDFMLVVDMKSNLLKIETMIRKINLQ